MKFYFLNWVQLSCDFDKVVFSVTTQGKVCWHTMNNVQMQCSQVVAKVNDELENWFLSQDVMDVLGVVYQ